MRCMAGMRSSSGMRGSSLKPHLTIAGSFEEKPSRAKSASSSDEGAIGEHRRTSHVLECARTSEPSTRLCLAARRAAIPAAPLVTTSFAGRSRPSCATWASRRSMPVVKARRPERHDDDRADAARRSSGTPRRAPRVHHLVVLQSFRGVEDDHRDALVRTLDANLKLSWSCASANDAPRRERCADARPTAGGAGMFRTRRDVLRRADDHSSSRARGAGTSCSHMSRPIFLYHLVRVRVRLSLRGLLHRAVVSALELLRGDFEPQPSSASFCFCARSPLEAQPRDARTSGRLLVAHPSPSPRRPAAPPRPIGTSPPAHGELVPSMPCSLARRSARAR